MRFTQINLHYFTLESCKSSLVDSAVYLIYIANYQIMYAQAPFI